jgi:hypothetical protein
MASSEQPLARPGIEPPGRKDAKEHENQDFKFRELLLVCLGVFAPWRFNL